MAVQDIYNKLSQVAGFNPATVEIFDDFLLEAGDIVNIISDGDHFDMPIFSQHMEWAGSMLTTLTSTGNEQRSELPPLQKRAKNSAYRAGRRVKEVEEEGVQYNRQLTATNKIVSSVMTVSGILLDANGDPVMRDGKYVYDPNGATAGAIASVAQQTATDLTGAVGRIGTVEGKVSTIEGSALWVNKDNVAAVTGKMVVDSNGNLVIVEGSGLKVYQNGTQVGIYENGHLNAGLIVDEINGDSNVKIKANRVNIASGSSSISLSDKIELDSSSYIKLKDTTIIAGNLQVGETTSSNNSITAKTHVVSSGGQITLVGSQSGEQYPISASNWPNVVTGFGSAIYPEGQTYDVSVPFYTIGKPSSNPDASNVINFSIANTAKYRADVGIASSGSINTSSAWTNDGEGGGYYKPIRATAKNGSYADATVSLPTITVDGALNSATATAELRAYGPAISGTAYAVSVAKNLYLKLSGNTVYLTNANAAPVTSGTSQNTLAMLDVSGVYNSGWDNAAVSMGMGAASSETEYNGWNTGYTPVTVSYGTGYRVYITKSDGQSVAGVKFIVPAQGSISGITLRSASVFDQSSNYYVIYPRATGSNLSNANNRYDTSLSFDASDAVNYGVGTVSNAISIGSALSSEPSADVNGGTLSADSWYLVTATASNGATKTLKLKTPVAGGTTYNEGWDALIAACQGSNASSYVQYSGASSVNSSPDKQAQKIDGYVWLKNSSGTWVRTRNIPISHTASATNVRSEYSNASGLYTFVSGSYVRLSNNKAYIFNA